MNGIKSNRYPGKPTHHGKYSRIGLLVHNLSFDLRLGVEDTTREQAANLIVFPGGIVKDPLAYNAQANILYNLIDPGQFDGLIMWTGALSGYLTPSQFQEFCEQFAPIPLVGVGGTLKNIPFVETGGYSSMCAEINHLIEVHGLRHIAFIRGAQGHEGAKDRYRAYRDTLTSHGIPLDPDLITPPSDEWERQEWGTEAVYLLLDKRKLKPGVDIEAIVGANDVVALGALDGLLGKRIRVPEDVALVGFDDLPESSYVSPPLTTVRRDYYGHGRQSAEWVLALIHGDPLPQSIPGPINLVLRRSCGCQEPVVSFAGKYSVKNTGEKKFTLAEVSSQSLLVPMLRTLEEAGIDIDHIGVENLLDSFVSELRDACTGAFMKELDRILSLEVTNGGKVPSWQMVISVLRQQVLRMEIDSPVYSLVETLFGQARIAIGSMAQRMEGYSRWHTDRQSLILREIEASISTIFDINGQMDVLAEALPRLGIPSCFLCLYESLSTELTSSSTPEWSRLVLAYSEKGRISINPTGIRFESRMLVPEEYWPKQRTYRYIIEPLYFRSDPLGFILFEIGPQDRTVYEVLQEQISNALWSNHLFQQATEARRLAEETNRVKTRFLYTVSHELRTPLNVIVGLSELLLRDRAQSNTSQMEDLYRIYSSAQHLGYLIRDVLDLASSDAGQLRLSCEPLDLIDTMQVVLLTGEQMARDQGLEWRVIMPSSQPMVWGDCTRLRQVALNFVSNAVKFTPHGTVTFSIQIDDGNATVLVSDTGVGVPLEDQSGVFNAFQQSERTVAFGYSGLGLGLSVCKHLIELHEGKIGLNSSGIVGEGATFYFSLPILSYQLSESSSVGFMPQHPILLLTDLKATGDRLGLYLREQGLNIFTQVISSDQDWLKTVIEISPSVLLFDRRLISKKAWDLIQKVKARPQAREISVVFYEWQPDANTGAVLELDYRLKPLDIDQLQKMVSKPDQNSPTSTILLVDDDPEILSVHTRLLHQQFPDCHVLQARNGREALELVGQQRPDLILLDLMMPELDGFGVLDALRERESTRDIPVTILTGQTLTDADLVRLSGGVITVLEKGIFSPEETLDRMAKKLVGMDKSRSAARQVVSKAMTFVHENFSESISREQISAFVNVHENYITNCFREVLGISPMTYLSRYRINQARILLETSNLNITQVAMAVGFPDAAYFSRIFQRELGLSPSVYRRGPHRERG